MEEVWKPVKGFEGLYEVSNFGRVKSLSRYVRNSQDRGDRLIRSRFLKQCEDTEHYLLVGLHKDGKQTMRKVHRLVAEVFLDNPHNFPQVNHKDENPQNNKLPNLEWCSARYNNNYGHHTGRQARTCSKPIVQKTLTGQLVHVWPSINEAKRHGYSTFHMVACCKNKEKKYRGFKWQYLNEVAS